MKMIDWINGVLDGTIIPLARVKTYTVKPVNTLCDTKNSTKRRPLGKVCHFPQGSSTKKKDTTTP
jgi:hypothetical protein